VTSKVRELLQYCSNIFKPKPKLSGSQWADEYFFTSAENSAIVGKWKTYPWQREILDVMTDNTTHYVHLLKATRVGATKLLNITHAYFTHQRPSGQLHYEPTNDEATRYATKEFEPTIRDNPEIDRLIQKPVVRGKTKPEKTLSKVYPAGFLEILGAETPKNFNGRTVRVVVIDEIDAVKKNSGSGLFIEQIFRRTSDYPDRKNITGGKPVGYAYVEDQEKRSFEGVSMSHYLFLQGTQEHWYRPCPHCDHFDVLDFNPDTFVWEKGKPKTAHFVCTSCGNKIEDKHKREMDLRGKWVAHNPKALEAKRRSFRVTGFMSYSPNVTWGDIAAEFVRASKNKPSLEVFYNEVLARPFNYDHNRVQTKDMLNRVEEYHSQVPTDVLILTAGADIQKNRIECEVIGWGVEYESWSIEYRVFHGDTTQKSVWEAFRAFLLTTIYTNDHEETMKIYMACVDCSYLIKTTTDFTAPLFARGIRAVKGSNNTKAPMTPRMASMFQKRNPFYTIGVNAIKDEISWHLQSVGGAGYMHFPNRPEYDEEYFAQLGAEARDGKGGYSKMRNRNEALDCRVYSFAALLMSEVDLELQSLRGERVGVLRQKRQTQKAPSRVSYLDRF